MTKLTSILLALVLLTGLAACQRNAAPASAGAEAQPLPGDADAAAAAATAPASEPPAGNGGVIAGKAPSTIEMPPADTPTPAIAAGAQIVYSCEDGGELHVAYSAHAATFALEDGRSVTLQRAESASKGSGDVYVSDTVGLQRLGNIVQVEQGSGATRVCAESGGNA